MGSVLLQNGPNSHSAWCKTQTNIRCHEIHFLLDDLVGCSFAGWKTEDAAIKFSMYWPRTWFSDLSLRFSSLTLSTLELRSSRVFCSSSTWAIRRAFSSCSSGVRSESNKKEVWLPEPPTNQHSKCKRKGMEFPQIWVWGRFLSFGVNYDTHLSTLLAKFESYTSPGLKQ